MTGTARGKEEEPDVTAQVHSLEKAKGRRSIPVESDPNMCAAMMMFGNSFSHDDERQQGCARFLCSLYGNKAKSSVQTVLQQ